MQIMDLLNVLGMIIAFAALLISWWTLKVTKKAVEQARLDWAKQKWFDLYFKADQAYNALDEYQALYQGCNQAYLHSRARDRSQRPHGHHSRGMHYGQRVPEEPSH